MRFIQRREREKEQRRQHFIDVGQAVFVESGYDGASIDAIAHRAEFSKRSVYLYFRDKRELFHAVVLRGLRQLNDVLSASIQQVETGIPRLYALADAYYRFFQDERGFFDLILDYEMRDYHYAKPRAEMGNYGQLCQEMNDRNTELVAEAVRQTIQAGESHTGGLNALQLTLIVWGQVVGILQMIARREDVLESAYGMSPESFFKRACEVSIRGVFGDADGRGRSTQRGTVG